MIEEETPPQDESPEGAPEGSEPAPEAPEDAPEASEDAPETPEADAPAEPEAEAAAAAEPAPDDAPPGERRGPKRRGKKEEKAEEEVIPGAHLEPDLVLEEEEPAEGLEDRYAEPEPHAEGEQATEEPKPEPGPVAATPLDLAADARYRATGKRKSAVARVILKPGEGAYSVNGRELDQFFPRHVLQSMARQPLEATGNAARMDVVARIHGGGVAAQAGALRHGIARALVEADPNLRGELKRRGYLTRDPRVKERKKAGLKKARKRPQFSKR